MYIYICTYTSHQLHQQIFTIIWTQSEKNIQIHLKTPISPPFPYGKNTCPPKWYPKKPSPKISPAFESHKPLPLTLLPN